MVKLGYADGGCANYNRPFLIIDIIDGYIYALNVSSLPGKTEKILYDSNIAINRFKPLFKVKSIVKVDAIYIIPIVNGLEKCLMAKGQMLHDADLEYIKNYYLDYRENKNVSIQEITIEHLVENNPDKIILDTNEIDNNAILV